MSKKELLLLIFSLFVLTVFSQKSNTVKSTKPQLTNALANTSCDCKTAVTINISKSIKYGLTKSPIGFGSSMEIKAKSKNDKNAFEQEHNTAWYLLNIEHDGELVFDIVSKDSTNDYDFLLYKVNDSAFCTDIINMKVMPVRSNLSRNNANTNGATGLSSAVKNNFSEKGQGDNYSHSIQVKKDEKYMLVLDNVYPNGKGHTIYFSYMVQINIKGTVVNFAKQPIAMEITVTDEKNNTIAKTNSDAKTGKYNFTATVKENAFYSVIYYNPSYFPESSYISSKLLKSNENILTIDKTMAGLKVGGTYTLTYYKYGLEVFQLYEEWPPLYLLGVLMKKNPTMKIRVEIHTPEDEKKIWGSGSPNSPNTLVTLPVWRVRNFKADLQHRGISTERMEIVPSDKMIVPNPKTDEDSKQNRAVTITILSK